MDTNNTLILFVASISLGTGVLFGLWTLLGLGQPSEIETEQQIDYTRVRHRKLREANVVFRHCYLLVLEWLPFSQGGTKIDTIRKDLPMGEKGKPWTAEEYLALIRTEALLLSLSAMIFLWIFVDPLAGLLLAPFVFLLYEPVRVNVLVDAAEKRRAAIRQRLPLMIDLLALSQGAGAPFQGSLKTAVRENQGHPISEEFGEVLRSIELGRSIRVALEDLAQKTADAQIDEFVFAINKAMELGVPVAETLSEIADQMRLKVQQWGEKAAAEAQVKIIFPSVLIMLACMIVIVAPFILPAIFGHAI